MRIELQYAWAFTLAAVILIAGFWPTFYGDPTQNEPVRTLHGVIASGWLVILIAQPWLIAARRPGLHRRLGVLAMVWFALLAASIAASIWRMLTEPKGVGDDMFARQAVGFLDVIGLPLITVLFFLTIRAAKARRIADHRRTLACLVAVILPTGMARLVTALTGHFSPINIVAVELAVLLAVLALAIRDRQSTGRWFRPYLVTMAMTIVPTLLLPAVIDSPMWLAVIRPVGYPG